MKYDSYGRAVYDWEKDFEAHQARQRNKLYAKENLINFMVRLKLISRSAYNNAMGHHY